MSTKRNIFLWKFHLRKRRKSLAWYMLRKHRLDAMKPLLDYFAGKNEKKLPISFFTEDIIFSDH